MYNVYFLVSALASNIYPLEAVDRGSETQLKVDEYSL